jgi:hypothetical protein
MSSAAPLWTGENTGADLAAASDHPAALIELIIDVIEGDVQIGRAATERIVAGSELAVRRSVDGAYR